MNSRVILATDNRHRTDELTEQVTEYLSSFLQFQSLYKAISQRPSIDEENEENGEEERGKMEKKMRTMKKRKMMNREDGGMTKTLMPPG